MPHAKRKFKLGSRIENLKLIVAGEVDVAGEFYRKPRILPACHQSDVERTAAVRPIHDCTSA
jgi:hypothetical protein